METADASVTGIFERIVSNPADARMVLDRFSEWSYADLRKLFESSPLKADGGAPFWVFWE